MASARTVITSSEDTIALTSTSLKAAIDAFWTSIAASHTPTAIDLGVHVEMTVRNAGLVQAINRLQCHWYENGAVVNTRIKNIWDGFATGLTAILAASTYSTQISLSYIATIEITYTP